jgi:hypothetical protein
VVRTKVPKSFVACAVVCLACLGWSTPGLAVLFYFTNSPAFNTNPPGGALTNSGWQFQGAWGGFSGTVISSNCFITAQHIGGATGELFVFQGVSYTTTAFYDDTNTDLRICRVDGQFPTNAQLYTKRSEVGQPLVVFGRGTQRGDPVLLKGKLRGWQWGTFDDVLRWGQNRVSAIVNNGPGTSDQLLRGSFKAGAGRNEADLSSGDSGGGVFIKDGKIYKLAGINYAVDGPYSFTNSGPGFPAALFNQRGFYTQYTTNAWTLISFGPVGGGFYATRISARAAWIRSVIAP